MQFLEARTRFAPLPHKMFEIRASDRWNMAQWFLTNEAAPRADKLLDIFAGAKNAEGVRSGGMVSRQQDSLRADGAKVLAETNFLTTLLWVLFGVGIGVAAAGRLSDQSLDREDGRRDGQACRRRSFRRDPRDRQAR